MKVACIGEAMVELSLDSGALGEARVGFAGDTLNTAIYLKRMAGSALQVSYVTRLGQDDFSRQMVAFMEAEGLGTETIARDPDRLPGLYAITTDATGERSFSYWREAAAARRLFQTGSGVDFTALLEFDVLFLSAITLAILPDNVRHALIAWLADYKTRTGGRVVFDSNYRARLWESPDTAREAIGAAWRVSDIALPSLDDEMAVFADADEAAVLARLRHCGITSGALKRGRAGPLSLADPGTEINFPPAAKVVDTTAAGDSFNGGYLAALLTGQSEAAALRAGHACACVVIGHHGAIVPADSMPPPFASLGTGA